MQLFNLILCWIFLGFLTAYLAGRKNKNPQIWFWVGLTLGLLGILLLYLIPEKVVKKPKAAPLKPVELPPPPQPQSEQEWHYYNNEKLRCGPIGRKELIELIEKKQLQAGSYVWTPGLEDWKKVQEIGDLQPPSPVKKEG